MSLSPNANLLHFLEKRAPDELQAIRRNDPENYELLQSRVVLDARGIDVKETGPLSPTQRESALRLIQSYTKTAIPAVSQLLSAIDKRLRRCHAVKLLGGAVAVVSGVALALLPSIGYDRATVAIWSAGFSCAGGLLTLLAGMLERSPNGQRMTVGDYQLLVNNRAELKGIERRLGADEVFTLSDAELVKLHNRSAEIADEIAKMEP